MKLDEWKPRTDIHSNNNNEQPIDDFIYRLAWEIKSERKYAGKTREKRRCKTIWSPESIRKWHSIQAACYTHSIYSSSNNKNYIDIERLVLCTVIIADAVTYEGKCVKLRIFE